MRIKGNKSICDLLVTGRKDQNLTQERAAQIIGVSRTTLSKMETDPDAIASASWNTVSRALRVAGFTMSVDVVPRVGDLTQITETQKQASDARLEDEEGYGPR